MASLGLTRVGRYALTLVAIAGIAVAIADDAIPRSGSEANLGPNVGGVVIVWTLAMLALIVAADAVLRTTIRAIRSRFANLS